MGEYILGKVKRFYTNHHRQENIIQIFQQGVAPGATPGSNRVNVLNMEFGKIPNFGIVTMKTSNS